MKTRAVRDSLAAAAITCAAILTCAWPTNTHADGPGLPEIDIGVDTTRMGSLQVQSNLVEDERVKGKWYLDVKVHNVGSEGRASAVIDEQVLKTAFRAEMSRSAPAAPSVAWHFKEKVEVLPNETVEIRHPLPPALCNQIASAMAQHKNRPNRDSWQAPPTTFFTSIAPVQPQIAPGQERLPPPLLAPQNRSAARMTERALSRP